LKRKVPSSRDQEDIEKMMDMIKSDKQLGNEVHENVQTLLVGYARHIKKPVDASDAFDKGFEKFHEDTVAELIKMGYDPVQADFIAWEGEYIHPEDMLDYNNKKTLADYNSVLRTLAKKSHIKLP
jgi:hypothetical protein